MASGGIFDFCGSMRPLLSAGEYHVTVEWLAASRPRPPAEAGIPPQPRCVPLRRILTGTDMIGFGDRLRRGLESRTHARAVRQFARSRHGLVSTSSWHRAEFDPWATHTRRIAVPRG